MLLDETMNGIRNLFDSAADRTAGVIDNSRIMLERQRLRGRLNEAYRMLGKAEYEAAYNGVSGMQEINSLMQEITELRRQLLACERGMQRGGAANCPNCGKLNSTEDAFCPACGTQLK